MGDAAQHWFSKAAADAAVVAARTGVARHDVAVVLGSGWGPAADMLGTLESEVPYAELGHFPPPTVAGHAGRLQSRRAGGAHVLVLQGRSHLYEGHPPAVVAHGVRVAAASGCGTIVLTNAAGALRPDLVVGRPVLLADHLNLTGRSPLEGPPPPRAFRFVDLTEAYSPRLRDLARSVDPSLPEGVYAALPGPHYETPAEIRMLRTLGADLVGMSTALETIAARHVGAEVLAVSLVTNVAAGLGGEPLHHGDVLAAGAQHAPVVGALLRGVIDRLWDQ